MGLITSLQMSSGGTGFHGPRWSWADQLDRVRYCSTCQCSQRIWPVAMLKISNAGGKYYTSHHLAVINVSLIPCIQHLQWGDVILSTYARTRYLGLRVNCHCRCWCLWRSHPKTMHTNGWWSQVATKILNVFHSLRATFAQFLLHGFYLLLPGICIFFHTCLAQFATLSTFLLTTWSTSKHFDAHNL